MPGNVTPLDNNYRPLASTSYDGVSGQYVGAHASGSVLQAPDGTSYSPSLFQHARQTRAVAAGTGTAPVVVKATPGILTTVVVTAAGSAQLNIYDNPSAASGTILAAIPASATVGQIFAVHMPANLGITAGQVSGSPAVTVAFV